MNKRSFISFTFFLLFIVATIVAWEKLIMPKPKEMISAPTREALELNGKIWHSLFRPVNLSVAKTDKVTRAPRFNGDVGLTSAIDLSKWKMTVLADDDDSKAKEFSLDMNDIHKLPATSGSAEFRCVEGWSEDISFTGVKFSDFLEQYKIGKKADGTYFPYVGFETPDGDYYVSIDMKSMLHPQTILAYEMNGKPLDLKNGAPLRLIIPVKYGIKNIKRIGKVFFSNERPRDYWTEEGYDWFAGL